MSYFPEIVLSTWTDGGAITLSSGTTTAPTKGTVDIDKQWYRTVNGVGEVELFYEQSAVGSGANGDGGTLLFTLPGGLTIGSGWGTVPSSTVAYDLPIGEGYVSLVYSTVVYYFKTACYAYSSTKFHIVCLHDSGTNTSAYTTSLCTNNFFRSTKCRIRLHLKFPLG